SVGLVGVDVHGGGILGADAANHITENQGTAVVVQLHGDNLLVLYAGLFGFFHVEVNVTLGDNHAVVQLHLTGRANQLAAGGTGQIAGLADGSGDAQLAGVGQSQLNLGLGADRSQNGHFHGTLGA